MKKCPVCEKEIKPYSLNIQTPLRNTKKCPHCGRLLRKKNSVWFIPVIIFVLISFILFSLHWAFHILILISLFVYLFFMYKLPYVPYNKDQLVDDSMIEKTTDEEVEVKGNK